MQIYKTTHFKVKDMQVKCTNDHFN